MATMDDELCSVFRKFLVLSASEFLGTAILLFVSCMGGSSDHNLMPLYGYFSSGLAVMIVMHLFANTSGAHVNPMTTICAIIMKKISMGWALVYVISQIIGSLVGYGLIKLVLPDHQTLLGVTKPSPIVNQTQALGIEMLITFVLALANCASWDRRNAKNDDSAAIRFGLLVFALNIVAATYTGASMNPARSFAPAFWNDYWTHQWIYWVAPLSAAVIASGLYRLLFLSSNNEQPKVCFPR